MIRKSPYRWDDVHQGVVKKTPKITTLMGKYGPPKTPRLPGTYNGDSLPKPNTKNFWKNQTP